MNKSKKLFPEYLRNVEKINGNKELIENLLNALNSSEKELENLKYVLKDLYIDELELKSNSIIVIKINTNLNEDKESLLTDLIKDVIPDDVYVLIVNNETNIEVFSEKEMNEMGWERSEKKL